MKSLKVVQIHKLESERVIKSRNSKISLSKGHDFQKFRQEFGENQPKVWENRPKLKNWPKFREKSL